MKVQYGKGFVIEAISMREQVERLEAQLVHMPQVDCPTVSYFAPGIYAREMTIPKGVTATGAVHKTEHLSIISAGRCLLTTDEGVKELSAPMTFVSKPGAKRAIYAIDTVVFTTIHATDEQDLEKLCEMLTESTHAELIGGTKNKQLLAQAAKPTLEN